MVLVVAATTTVSGFACGSNSVKSQETGQIHYTGTIKFNPSHKTKNCGFAIKNGKYVKKATHKYVRNGKIIKSGIAGPAKNKNPKVYTNRITCFDDVRWGKKYTTNAGKKSTKITVTAYLQKKSGKSWKSIASWNDSTTSNSLTLNKSKKLSKGRYRVKSVTKAYKGKASETITDYSPEKKY